MRIKSLLIILSFLLLKCSVLHADNFLVSIAITEGESSKDSWSSNTSINIIGNTLSYFKSYGGSKKRKNDSIDKNYSLTNEQVSSIRSLIRDLGLMTSQEVITERKSPSHFVTISGDFIMEERSSRIRIDGEYGLVEVNDLYKNSYEVINLIEKYLNGN